MRIVVTGAGGQLGRDLQEALARRGHEVLPLGRRELDVTRPEQCRDVMVSLRPDAVVHAAAYTAVDQAEHDPDGAYAVNAFGTRNVAAAAERVGAKLCYISTDYVFDGRAEAPYREFDRPNPLNVYGRSKLAGEGMVRSFSSRHYIVRTSWLYGLHGANFVKTMLRLAREREYVQVVDDQVGSPTSSADLSGFVAELVETELYGIYHASNAGQCSWYEFAGAVFELSGLEVDLRPCRTDEFPRPAVRPAFSVLDNMAIRLNGFTPLRGWREALEEFLDRYGKA